MPGDFSPGDKVVCISLEMSCGQIHNKHAGEMPVIGRAYTVASVHMGYCMVCHRAHISHRAPAFCPREVSLRGNRAWPQECFRKIEPEHGADTLATMLRKHASKKKELLA